MNSVEKTSAILGIILQEKELTAAQIAELSEISLPSVYRILATLSDYGLVEHDYSGKFFTVGWSIQKLAFQNNSFLQERLVQRIHPLLGEAVRETAQTCTLSFLSGNRVVVVDIIEADTSLRYTAKIGKEMPWNASAPGKLFFAYQDSPSVKTRILQNMKFTRYTENTILDSDAYQKAVAGVRADGFASSVNEFDSFCTALSVPIFNAADQMVFALSAIGHCDEMKEKQARILSVLHAKAEEATKALSR